MNPTPLRRWRDDASTIGRAAARSGPATRPAPGPAARGGPHGVPPGGRRQDRPAAGPVTGRAVPDGVIPVRRFDAPHGITLYLAVARGDPALRTRPADCGLRVCPGRLGDAEARRLSRRLARETRIRNETHRTGFRGAQLLATGVDRADPALLRSVAALLDGMRGAVYTGADLGVTARDIARLAVMTRYVLGAPCPRPDPVAPATATACGVLGAIEAWAGGPVAGLRVLVHGAGSVGGALAARLARAGAAVLVHDARPDVPTPAGCHRVGDWTGHPVDVVAPCSCGDLIDPALARRLSCGAVIGSAGAVLTDEAATSTVLHHRGITYLPTPVINAGAALTHSIQHYAPDAYRRAAAEDVYAFVRRSVRRAAAELADAARREGRSPAATLLRRRAAPPARARGLDFAAGEAAGPAGGR